MTDSHQESIDKGVLDGIVKFGKDRININKYHNVKQHDHHKDYRKCFAWKSAHAFGDSQVKIKKSGSYQHDQMDSNGLL